MKTVSLSRDLIHTGNLILINGRYPYRETAANRSLVALEEGIRLERQVAAVYTKLMEALSAREQIVAVSGWRSREEQEQIYRESLLENGADFTTKYVALPGHSEHQTGLAVDLALQQEEIDFLCPHFPNTGICGDFREKAGYFGLIERYPQNKEDITGIAYEPWHFRYVGAPHGMIMQCTGDTLEEYHARLKQHPYGEKPMQYAFDGLKIEVGYLPAEDETTEFEIAADASYAVSGNNMDGFIVTLAVWV